MMTKMKFQGRLGKHETGPLSPLGILWDRTGLLGVGATRETRILGPAPVFQLTVQQDGQVTTYDFSTRQARRDETVLRIGVGPPLQYPPIKTEYVAVKGDVRPFHVLFKVDPSEDVLEVQVKTKHATNVTVAGQPLKSGTWVDLDVSDTVTFGGVECSYSQTTKISSLFVRPPQPLMAWSSSRLNHDLPPPSFKRKAHPSSSHRDDDRYAPRPRRPAPHRPHDHPRRHYGPLPR